VLDGLAFAGDAILTEASTVSALLSPASVRAVGA
jgi:hypothetical protein